MKVNISVELTGQEISNNILTELQKQGIAVVEGSVAKCLVMNKKDEQVEVGLDKVKFVFNR